MKHHRFVRRLTYVSAALIALTVIAFVLKFYSNPWADKPDQWAQFGEYFGGILNPLFTLMNVAVIVYIATVLQAFTEAEKNKEAISTQRVETVTALHREWNSESIFHSRTLAGNLVLKHVGSTMPDMQKVVASEQLMHLWIVIGFFQRLSYLVRKDQVDNEMAVDLFGEHFTWWWVVSFEKQLMPVDWEAVEKIRSFKVWLDANTTPQQRGPWERRARQARDEVPVAP